jgi:hypothetical protein
MGYNVEDARVPMQGRKVRHAQCDAHLQTRANHAGASGQVAVLLGFCKFIANIIQLGDGKPRRKEVS